MSNIFIGEWSPANPLPEGFLDLPPSIYRDWPLWPGEDREKVQQQFSLKNSWFNHSKAWIGCIPGKARLVGFLVPHRVDGRSAAFFGFWETDNDIASNTMLFSALEQWAKENGACNLYGPINFSTFGHYRVRLDHFDVPPFEHEPYNPPYYHLLLKELGFDIRYRYTSIFDDTQAIEGNFRQAHQRAQRLPDVPATLLPLTPELWMQEQVKLYSFIDSVFGENFAYTTPSWATFQQHCGKEFIKPFCHYPASFLAKTPSGEIAGIILSLSVLQKGQPAIGLLKTVAVAPQYRRSRLYNTLYHSFEQSARRIHPRLGGAMMREDNTSLKTAKRLFNTPAATKHQYALYYRGDRMTNICQPIVDAAQKHPEHLALQTPHSRDHSNGLSFQEFFSHASHFQYQLTQAGFVAGDRLLVIIQPSLVLYPLLIAILGLGLVPVMLERGLAKKQLREILRHSKLSAVITQPTLGKFWFLIPELWRLRRFVIGQRILGMKVLETPNQHLPLSSFICRDLPSDTTGLITFTSGSTGTPKGANRTHDSLLAQLYAITALFIEGKNEIDLHSFPVMVLHSLCCGNSSILPDFDFAHPATVDPQKIVKQVQDKSVTCLSGAPAYMNKVTGYAKSKGLSFPNVRTVIVGGAPANKALLENCLTVFPYARHLVVYGSTEVEPISTVEMTTQLNHWATHDGYLVGKPVTQAEICIREITANPQQITPLAAGNVGEILVAGPHVLKDYIDNPQATKKNKLPRKQGGIWHCTGDIGYLDTTGQLWLLGRVKDKVVLDDGHIIHPYVLEKRINELPGVTQSAFVLHPLGGAALILESATLPTDLPAILDELDLTQVTRIYCANPIPVDIRHNSKINRIALINMLGKGQLSSVPHKEKL